MIPSDRFFQWRTIDRNVMQSIYVGRWNEALPAYVVNHRQPIHSIELLDCLVCMRCAD